MRILITGGAGFIGSNFTRYWSKYHPKDKIVVYDKLTYAGNLNNLEDLLEKNRIEFVKRDICNQSAMNSAIKHFKIDTIVNFAAETHVDRSISGPSAFIKTNVMGTYSILEAMRSHPTIRLHHISTDEVYGSLPLNRPSMKFTEVTPYDPKSPYSASKAASDHLVRSYVNTFGIKATISNCSNNFGPFCHIEKLIPLTITRALNNEEVPVYGNGMQVRDWIHVEDHCNGVKLILERGKIGETYLLGGDGEKPNLWIIKKILALLGKPETLITYVQDRKGHDVRYAVDYSKAKMELGFKPQKTTDKWLEDTVTWYVKNKAWWAGRKSGAHVIARNYLKNKK